MYNANACNAIEVNTRILPGSLQIFGQQFTSRDIIRLYQGLIEKRSLQHSTRVTLFSLHSALFRLYRKINTNDIISKCQKIVSLI